MQEIVSFLVEHPEVLEQVIAGKASLIGVDKDQIFGLIEGFKRIEAGWGPYPNLWFK
ncbi:competence pheromone ComX [Bacillus sp. GM2]|uniref:competence pheromone ComX n=1 Tax=Bacillus TaxID=1386 RepID=UPI000952B5BA|nr:competence pheromone ComX [Bacillus paralicheniformis]MSN99181.1 competence pheromone ComX [Bacillus paralicheniformis]MSO03189.1 competence pheromone ComX [Bacillus paralicheniformis]MSO07182.1 competence pheromone ComX [Bacillus paralicheniformis]MSO11176.1 competence pheromone ComX [Bacillus paralicheniformis]NJE35739.1 competence pheromone ComX [Bacillus paralicheniformis]